MDIIYTAAQMMELSARTAPKSLGQDFIATKIVSGDVIFKLADELDRIFSETQRENFDRDAETIRKSEAVLFIGIKDSREIGLNCGACGFDTCEENLVNREKRTDFVGPLCSFRMLDMGIALGSAVKTASILNVDNRIMYRAALAAINIGLLDWEFVMGIPLAATGKSIFFDR